MPQPTSRWTFPLSTSPYLGDSLLVTLRDYWKLSRRDGLTITEYIAERCAELYQVRPPLGAVDFLLLEGAGLVVFDGLDEILNVTERGRVVDTIELFAQLYPNCPLLVTSRINGYENTPLSDELFTPYVILPFDDPEVRRYVDVWFGLDKDTSLPVLRGHKQTFLQNISTLDRDLYTNPLTLALLCNLSKANNYQPLPKSRAEIFEKCSLMLYDRWDSLRGIGNVEFERGFLPVIAFAADRILEDPDLASGLTEHRLVNLCVEYLVPNKMEDMGEALQYARSLIEHCVGRAWVFSAVGTNQDGEELFSFTHRTFLEYFAAVHLTRSNSTALELAKRLGPWILRGERSLITQIAFEVKTRALDSGAEDFCEEILALTNAASAKGKVDAIQWLCQEASLIPIGHAVLRRIVQLALSLPGRQMVIWGYLATATGENRRFIDREVAEFADAEVSTASGKGHSSDLSVPAVIVRLFLMERTGEERSFWVALEDRLPKPPPRSKWE